jgi:uroporphyrinogen decarboxylase
MQAERTRHAPGKDGTAAAPAPLFLRACRQEPVERTPIWIMRQAGRYLPEYRALRQRVDFLTCCRTPDLICEITLQPLRRFDLDAAILFSDILLPLPGMGVEVAFNPGPKLARPVRTAGDVAALRPADPYETTPAAIEAVRLLRRALDPATPLIGFAGAPFTIATYLVEGGGSKHFEAIKSLLFADPATAHRLLDVCAQTAAASLAAQVRAGAQAAMLFDTWAGLLAEEDYRTFALPHVRRVFDAVAGAAAAMGVEVPRLYYAGNGGGLLESCRESGATVIGVDWRTDLRTARARLGPSFAVQGNLDPAVLLGPPDVVRARAGRVLEAAGPRGHVFNLGHGILPSTPPDHVRVLVDAVHAHQGARA